MNDSKATVCKKPTVQRVTVPDHPKMSSESEAETEAGDGSADNVEATQQELTAEPCEASVPARPFLLLVHRANGLR